MHRRGHAEATSPPLMPCTGASGSWEAHREGEVKELCNQEDELGNLQGSAVGRHLLLSDEEVQVGGQLWDDGEHEHHHEVGDLQHAPHAEWTLCKEWLSLLCMHVGSTGESVCVLYVHSVMVEGRQG